MDRLERDAQGGVASTVTARVQIPTVESDLRQHGKKSNEFDKRYSV